MNAPNSRQATAQARQLAVAIFLYNSARAAVSVNPSSLTFTFMAGGKRAGASSVGSFERYIIASRFQRARRSDRHDWCGGRSGRRRCAFDSECVS